jgi:hypothetical protein
MKYQYQSKGGAMSELRRLLHELHKRIKENGGKIADSMRLLVMRIRKLVMELRASVSGREMKRLLGGLAVILGISFSQNVEAQSFAAPVLSPFGLDTVNYMAFPEFADLDDDGDLDLLVVEYYGSIKYFENTGSASNPSFAAPSTNPFGLVASSYYLMPAFADLDNDGDLDLVIGGYDGNMRYFKNSGTAANPNFDAPVLNTFGMSPVYGMFWPELADLDDDGDFDLMKGGYYGVFNYQKNNGSASSPMFGTNQANPFGLDSAYYWSSPALADLDGDGDLDLLSGSYYGLLYYYYENTGTKTNPQFATSQTNPFGLTPPPGYTYFASPTFADLDNDGDMDLMVGTAGYGGKLYYYENTSPIISIDEIEQADHLIYPNPTKDRFFVEGSSKIESVEIIDIHGRTVLRAEYSDAGIDISELSAGTYFVRMHQKGELIAVSRLMVD